MEKEMSGTTKRQYTKEYRVQAVKLVVEQGLGLREAADRLGVAVQTYANWVKLAKQGKLESVDAHRIAPVSELQAEITRLKRALAIAEEERDILKKATAYFAKVAK
jgi:transposase